MRVPLPSARTRWTLAGLVAGLLLAGTLAPVGADGAAPVVLGVGADKWAHAAGFGALAAATAAALDGPARRPGAVLGGALLAALAVGGGVELLQPLVGRDAEVGDLLADVLGAAAALLAYRLGHRWVQWG